MAVTVYTSDDISAPIITGQVGSLITVLDACLINGYGSKLAAGWTKPFSETNKAGYRQGLGSLNHYLNVDDSASVVPAVPNEARIRGYEIMTAVGAGSNLYPTVVQQATGLKVRKSTTIDDIARPWIVIADHRTIYMWVMTGDLASNVYYGWAFGEYYSFKSGDQGRNFIQGRIVENNNGVSAAYDGMDQTTYVGGTVAGMFMNRDVNGAIGSIPCGKMGDWELTLNGTGAMIGVLQFTNPADAKVYLAPLRVNCSVSDVTIRGRLRGMWFFAHPQSSVADRDTFLGVDDLAGKTFLIIKKSNTNAIWCVEISSTWETN